MLQVRERFLNIWRRESGLPCFFCCCPYGTIKRKYAGIVSPAATESREFKSSTRATPFTQNMKNKRELQFTSCYHIYKSLSQFKTHRNGIYAKIKTDMERNEKTFLRKSGQDVWVHKRKYWIYMTCLRTLENSFRCRSLMRLFVFLVWPKASTVLAKTVHHLV